MLRSTIYDVLDIIKSLQSLKKYFLNRFDYPVIVLIEKSLNTEFKDKIVRESEVDVQFALIEFRIPDKFLDKKILK